MKKDLNIGIQLKPTAKTEKKKKKKKFKVFWAGSCARMNNPACT